MTTLSTAHPLLTLPMFGAPSPSGGGAGGEGPFVAVNHRPAGRMKPKSCP